MAQYVTHNPGTYEEIDLRCPNCNSHKVLVKVDSKGYFYIAECHKCGFKEKNYD